MFVITADQVRSRSHSDRVGATIELITHHYAVTLILAPERTAGDELQLATAAAETALDVVLELHRSAEWSIGVGCGTVRTPLPQSTREATGSAFFAARDAVTRSKNRTSRFALSTESDVTASTDTEALIELLLVLRDRRTMGGWELYDMLAHGVTQRDAAERLGVTPPAVSARARAAGLRAEEAAKPALVRLLEQLDSIVTDSEA